LSRLRRIAPLAAALALAALQNPHPAHGQQPPPDNGGGMGGGGGFGGGGGDMPPGGGPPSQAQMQERMIRNLKRQLDATSADFTAMLPDIEKIIQLRQAVDANVRPGPPGRPGGDDNGGGGGPQDMNGGGGNGPPGDPNGGGGPPDMNAGGGGGNDQNANADANANGNNDAAATPHRHRRGAQDGNDAQTADNGGNDPDAGPVTGDAVAADLTTKVRTLRADLRQSGPADGGSDTDLSHDVAAVRAARAKAVDELAAARKDLKGLVKSPRQEAVFVATGILE
jgi:hypothetical protein